MRTEPQHVAHRILKGLVTIPCALLLTAAAHAQCPADLTDDGTVGGMDLSVLMAAWATDGSQQPGSDINGDGVVGGADLAALLGAWGPCVTTPAWATLIEAWPDPAVVTDANLRAAITATGLAWRVKDTATQIEFVLIPPGSFQMGCSASQWFPCNPDESPVHTVTLTNAFYMGRYEVTQAQWQARMGLNPSYFQSVSEEVSATEVPNRPVERVSWVMIQGFLTLGMRLPTEAEWEYAYRAGTTTAFHGFAGSLNGTNDDSQLVNIAWYAANEGTQTRPVGGKFGNGYGLHDMSGNVIEWMSDQYDMNYYGSSPQNNPPGPDKGSTRVLRGGCFETRFDSTNTCRAPYRSALDPENSTGTVGFRVARTP